MKISYVGDMPVVSQHGVGFDKTKPDRYTYLYPALELLEALSYGATETTQHLYKSEHKELKPKELLEGLKKFVPNLEEIYETRLHKAEEFIEELKERVEKNENLSSDEKRAWLGNIKLMSEYYLQYITNKIVYEAALEALSDEVAVAKVEELKIPMFRNYGIVVSDLQSVLEKRKAPIESSFEVDTTDDGIVGTIRFRHI